LVERLEGVVNFSDGQFGDERCRVGRINDHSEGVRAPQNHSTGRGVWSALRPCKFDISRLNCNDDHHKVAVAMRASIQYLLSSIILVLGPN